MRSTDTFKGIAVLSALAIGLNATAQGVEYPFPDGTQLITEQPAGESAWYSRSCVKYMQLLGPLEYGGESSVPSKIVEAGTENVYIGNMFTDFSGAGWLTGTSDPGKGVCLQFPQIMFDEEYSDGSHYYYYACCMRLNADNTDFEIAEQQSISLEYDEAGNLKVTDPDMAIGICYVYDPSTGEQSVETGHEGCELKWFGIAYSNISWLTVDTATARIPDGVERQQYALCHSTGARFVDIAVDDNRIYIPGLSEDPDACIVGDIAADGHTVTFPTNQFMCVLESGDYFCYMVAAAPEDIYYPETGETVHTIAPADSFTAIWDSEKKSLVFADSETGFSISNEQENIGGGDLYLEPKMTQQDDYVAATPASPQILVYNPYTAEQGYGTLNFNLPIWTDDGLLVNPERMFYNIYLDDNVMTLSPDVYMSLTEDVSDIPYGFTDNYDIFSVGLNHAIYLYTGDYARIGVQSYVEVDGDRYHSPIAYASNSSVNVIAGTGRNITETYYLDLAGVRISEPQSGFAIKCIRYDDGSIETEKIMVR